MMEFWTAFGAIAQAAGAVATLAAVVFSLRLARAASQPKLYASVDYERDIADEQYESIVFNVANVGAVPAEIIAVGWEIGWFSRTRRLVDFDLTHGRPTFPHVLKPGEAISYYLSVELTLAEIKRHPRVYRQTALPGLSITRRLRGIVHLWSGTSPLVVPSRAVLGLIAGKDREALSPTTYRLPGHFPPLRNLD